MKESIRDNQEEIVRSIEKLTFRIMDLETALKDAKLKIRIFNFMHQNEYVYLESDEYSFYDANYLSYLESEGFHKHSDFQEWDSVNRAVLFIKSKVTQKGKKK